MTLALALPTDNGVEPLASIAFQGLHPSLRVYGDHAFDVPMVFFDIETTGLVAGYDKIIEIGAVKYDARKRLVSTWHQYYDPEMSIPDEAAAVHGISDKIMKEMVNRGQAITMTKRSLESLRGFIGDAKTVAHNGEVFDGPFVDQTCRSLKIDPIISTAGVIDTLNIARMRWPGRKASLDEICPRVGVDLSIRQGGHGALIDSILLAMVFPQMVQGGNENLLSSLIDTRPAPEAYGRVGDRLLWSPSVVEVERHTSMMKAIQKKAAKS